MTSPTGAGDGGEMAHGRLWLAETLWKLGCVQFGDFSLGRTVRNSPVYLNPKLLISQPEALQRTIRLIAEDFVRVGEVVETINGRQSPAAAAGIRGGSMIVSVDGQAIARWQDLIDRFREVVATRSMLP